MVKTAELAAQIGRDLLADREAQGAPRAAADEFVRALLDVNQKAKLPSILAKKLVRDWMAETGVTETKLREALAKARRADRKSAPEHRIKLPPKRRRITAQEEPAIKQSPPEAPPAKAGQRSPPGGNDLLDGMVPN